MARVKGALSTRKRRNKTLKLAKGYFGAKSKLFKTAKELGALQEASSKASENEQEEYTLKMLKAVIPDFKDEDLEGIDPIELGQFFRELGIEIAEVVKQAQKN